MGIEPMAEGASGEDNRCMHTADRLRRSGRWLPDRRLARRSRGLLLGGVWLRCRTRWRARALDRRLAAGADPMESDELSLRVAQLGSAKTRGRLAAELRAAVVLAEAPFDPLRMTSTRLRRGDNRANRALLLELADRVQADVPLGVEGLARTDRLVRDSASALYRTDAERPLGVAAFEALVALDRGHRTASTGGRAR